MSIRFIDDLILDLYIKKEYLDDIDFNNREDLEKYLKKIFRKLNNKYDIKIEGFYEITVYIDKYYGVVLHLEKEKLEYYEHFKNKVDMRVITINTDFMYLVDDIPFEILDKINIKIKNKNIYLLIKKDLTKLEMMNLMENSKLVYTY